LFHGFVVAQDKFVGKWVANSMDKWWDKFYPRTVRPSLFDYTCGEDFLFCSHAWNR